MSCDINLPGVEELSQQSCHSSNKWRAYQPKHLHADNDPVRQNPVGTIRPQTRHPRHESSRDGKWPPEQQHTLDSEWPQSGEASHGGHREDLTNPLLFKHLQDPLHLEDEDDYFDVSDDDMADFERESEVASEDQYLRSNELGLAFAIQARQDMHDQRLRSYVSLLDDANLLATYRPSARLSPLQDPTTARIFCYFVNVTGPSLSMYERHMANPALMLQGRPVPPSQQHLWSFFFPTLALSNPALLHSILAIASLQISQLQGGTQFPAMKHHQLALRRVARSVGLPTRRNHLETLAATLLLGFFELFSADHHKWSSHLLGATQLVKEIDFLSVARYIKARKLMERSDNWAHEHGSYSPEGSRGHSSTNRSESTVEQKAPTMFDDEDVDENMVDVIMGKAICDSKRGRVNSGFLESDRHVYQLKEYTSKDIEIYEKQRDLFWWFCKQDVYQSILSGNRLLYGLYYLEVMVYTNSYQSKL